MFDEENKYILEPRLWRQKRAIGHIRRLSPSPPIRELNYYILSENNRFADPRLSAENSIGPLQSLRPPPPL